MNNLKTKFDDLDVDKLENIDLKKISDAVSKKVVKKTLYHKLNTQVNNLTHVTTLIHINQYNTNKKNKIWRKKWGC